MPTVPVELDVHGGQEDLLEVEQAFLDLVCADEQLLRAEFDAIIAREWPTRRPPVRRSWVWPGTDPDPRRRLARRGWRPFLGHARPPGARRWRRQRSPPRGRARALLK